MYVSPSCGEPETVRVGLNNARFKPTFVAFVLGVTITHDLSWALNISNCCNKTRKLIGLLYRRFHHHASSITLLTVHVVSFGHTWSVLPESIAWNPGLKGDVDVLEDVQKFALRVCFKS